MSDTQQQIGRPVRVKIMLGCRLIQEWDGVFHAWTQEQLSITVPWETVGIVEDGDGHLHLIRARDLQFRDRLTG